MYQIPQFKAIPGFIHIFSERSEGNMAYVVSGKPLDANEITNNRERFFSSNHISMEKAVALHVQGRDGVEVVRKKDLNFNVIDSSKAIVTDALFTNKKSIYMMLLVADCAPLITYDPKKEVIGLLHVGWRGADLGIVGKAIKRLRDLYKVNAQDLIVGIGPAARKDSFIKQNPSQKNDPKWKPFLEEVGDNMYKVDFVGLLKKQLIDAGVGKKNISDCYIDPVRDNRFYSHVRESRLPLSKQGRFACVVGMKTT